MADIKKIIYIYPIPKEKCPSDAPIADVRTVRRATMTTREEMATTSLVPPSGLPYLPYTAAHRYCVHGVCTITRITNGRYNARDFSSRGVRVRRSVRVICAKPQVLSR